MAFDQIRSKFQIGKRIYRRQRDRLRRFQEGKPVNPPSFIAQTMDVDDERRARTWLDRTNDWYDSDVVETYETRFAEINDSQCATAFMGGRVALSAAIHALDLQPGDEVIVPAFTCIVVPNAFRYAGVNVRFADIELQTFGLSAESTEASISSRTRAILIQHLFGLVCRDYRRLIDLASNNDLAVIEDCTHATGATYDGRPVGNLGDVAFYSSEHSKVFTTAQGGVATTNDTRIAHRLRDFQMRAPYPSATRIQRLLQTYRVDYYKHAHSHPWLFGDYFQLQYRQAYLSSTVMEEMESRKPPHYGQRMPAPIAALGLGQIDKLGQYASKRRSAAQKWHAWCESNGYPRPLVIPNSSPAWLRYPVLVEPEKKTDTDWALSELGVRPGVWFKSHVHPVEDSVFSPIDHCPNADRAVTCCINLPTLLD